MFNLRRWWLLCGVVLVGVVALNGVVDGVADAHPVAAPRAVCVRGGATATDGVSGRGLVCVQTTARGLRWRFQPTAVTTTTTTTSPSTTTTSPSTTTTTVSGVVAPVLVSVSASDGVRVTVAGMRPDTGVYALQWVPYGQTFNTYQMARATSASMSVPAGWFACNRTYTFRVFVMQAGWQLADGHQTQNVTHHSTPFDVVMPACPAPTVPTVTCATGGVCIVGDTGPGGGIVFYVQASGGTFTSTGSDCGTTCKYLEAARSDQSTGIVWATTDEMCYNPNNSNNGVCQTTSVYEGSDAARISSRAASEAIGKGMANTENFAGRLAGYPQNSTNFAAGIARTYVNNGKTDWHLPSKDELNQLYIHKTTVGGFSSGDYWSSSEFAADFAWLQWFLFGDQGNDFKSYTAYVRPVRAF